MTQQLKEAIKALSSLQDLSEQQQQQVAIGVLQLVKSVTSHHPQLEGKEKKPIWEVLADLGQSMPEEVLKHLPEDGATEHDHYIYGTPKQQP